MYRSNGLMPVLFIGHGSPVNAIENNEFTKGWRRIVEDIDRPEALLCVSAHWETRGTFVTAMEKPRTIHDFSGFPRELYEVSYSAPGCPWLAREIKASVRIAGVGLDVEWGLDHGCWSVAKQMFPRADIPVAQLSLDYTQPTRFHYDLGKELAGLRTRGVLILSSGNLVHNLNLARPGGGDFNEPFGFDWAIEADALLVKLIRENRHEDLIAYQSLGPAVQLAVPTPDHYLPMLYAIALRKENETISVFNDSAVAGSLTMTSFRIG